MGRIMFTSPKVEDLNAATQEGCVHLAHICQNICPRGQNNCTLCSGTITIFAILTPLGVRDQKLHRTGSHSSIPFIYISRMDI